MSEDRKQIGVSFRNFWKPEKVCSAERKKGKDISMKMIIVIVTSYLCLWSLAEVFPIQLQDGRSDL